MYAYDRAFLGYVALSAAPSARAVVPVVQQMLRVGSVLDVGCGSGAWLREWQRNGVSRCLGLDGPYVDLASLLIGPQHFQAHDLRVPFALGQRFDLVSCLEVGEHLPADSAAGLVQSLCAHGDVVLFSAATPGQGGEHHVNEQLYEWWKQLFEANGYRMFDCVRPAVAARRGISPWYRYNAFIYAREARAATLPPAVRATHVPPGSVPRDVAPRWYRWRRALIGLLPVSAVTRLSIVKKRAVYRWRSG